MANRIKLTKSTHVCTICRFNISRTRKAFRSEGYNFALACTGNWVRVYYTIARSQLVQLQRLARILKIRTVQTDLLYFLDSE